MTTGVEEDVVRNPATQGRASSGGDRPAALAGARLLLDPRLVERSDKAKADLAASTPGAAADERILHELAAEELGLVGALHEAEAALVAKIAAKLDDPRSAFVLAKVARELVALSSSLGRRVEGCLTAAASLRAQRHMLAGHRGHRV